jgi:hypothetical protein
VTLQIGLRDRRDADASVPAVAKPNLRYKSADEGNRFQPTYPEFGTHH